MASTARAIVPVSVGRWPSLTVSFVCLHARQGDSELHERLLALKARWEVSSFELRMEESRVTGDGRYLRALREWIAHPPGFLTESLSTTAFKQTSIHLC